MSYVVKAQHASDSSTPKISHTVSDIAVKTRETRSDNPETFYDLSPTKKSDEETFSLGDSSVVSGELGAEFASKLKFDEPELKPYTLQHDDDDDFSIAHEKAKSLAAELEVLTEPGKTASTIAFGGDKPLNYSFFATPTASDASADAPFRLSAFGESKTLDIAASDLPTVAGKTVDSIESTAVDSSDTAASSAEGSDVHDLGATSAPYFPSDPSGLADTASVTETDDTGDTGKSAAAESALLHTEEVETLDLGATGGTVDIGLDVVSRNWANMKTVFETRYNPPGFVKYQYANDLFNTKQGDSSVDDFCAKMQKLGREVNASEEMLRFAVINGLKPDIRNHVTRTQPTTWNDLVQHARIGEMCLPVAPPTDPTLAVKLEVIQDQLKQLTTTSKVSSTSPVCFAGRQDSRSRGESPRTSSPVRRVCFDRSAD